MRSWNVISKVVSIISMRGSGIGPLWTMGQQYGRNAQIPIVAVPTIKSNRHLSDPIASYGENSAFDTFHAGTKISTQKLFKELDVPSPRFEKIVQGLEREGFIVRKGNYICIKQ